MLGWEVEGFRNISKQGQAPPAQPRTAASERDIPTWTPTVTSSPMFTQILHLDPPRSFQSTLVCSEQSCMSGKAGLSAISVVQVRTVRLGGIYPRPQLQGVAEAGGAPHLHLVLFPAVLLCQLPLCSYIGGRHPKLISSVLREFSFLVKNVQVHKEGREGKRRPSHNMN